MPAKRNVPQTHLSQDPGREGDSTTPVKRQIVGGVAMPEKRNTAQTHLSQDPGRKGDSTTPTKCQIVGGVAMPAKQNTAQTHPQQARAEKTIPQRPLNAELWAVWNMAERRNWYVPTAGTTQQPTGHLARHCHAPTFSQNDL